MPSLRLTRRDLLRRGSALAIGSLTAAGVAHDLILPNATLAVALSRVSGVVSSSDGLNLHSGPGARHPVTTWLPNGAILSITGTSGDWFKVRTQGTAGWVSSWHVTLSGLRSVAHARGDARYKRVALTFDCGSDLGFTDQILDTLSEHSVPASFGFTGDWVKTSPDRARAIADRGYQLINHTLSHPSFTGLSLGVGPRSPAKRLSQVEATEALIREVTGASTKPYWRPPYGDYDESVLRDVGALGYTRTAMWTIDSFGWNGFTADEIYQHVMSNMVWGAIVLMHVGAQSQDANALDRIIRDLKELGYSFGTVAQVLARPVRPQLDVLACSACVPSSASTYRASTKRSDESRLR